MSLSQPPCPTFGEKTIQLPYFPIICALGEHYISLGSYNLLSDFQHPQGRQHLLRVPVLWHLRGGVPSSHSCCCHHWPSRNIEIIISNIFLKWILKIQEEQLSKTEHIRLTSYGNHLASPSVASSPASSSGSDSSAGGGGKAGKPLRTWDDCLHREGPPTKTSCGPAYTSRLAKQWKSISIYQHTPTNIFLCTHRFQYKFVTTYIDIRYFQWTSWKKDMELWIAAKAAKIASGHALEGRS